MLALTVFHNWFKSSIHKWLQIVHDRSGDRIRKAVEADTVRGPAPKTHMSALIKPETFKLFRKSQHVFLFILSEIRLDKEEKKVLIPTRQQTINTQ